ncbi:gluconate 2-dehydrogenase subunit 3-like protein [Anseongella ginsenosidimutans]|uniref:Gluconate 2-dehydrogenase subunit 3-like protein n=1 Tax=Anseongella ginsenosidimutans TaxID=496056 RepID=A0A4R3KV97_9SPHI|nr:gluconate 2-dehydrogenase subunit 3 family protein [Anseongella ginsenosidimutans]QEC51864.1 gluconate 2-dehydrogenase subunit 3 family protein [Anseongella ginsenosidimutans]TCS89245.1 gluconate 2-dehydrogenase subunit 3-like protein [Anseongella ginsenosidimutans]
MKRRTAIRQLVVVAGGLALLPSCLSGPGNAAIKLSNIILSGEQEKTLAEIAGTIIPATDTPGAKELGVHLFVLKMLDDCYEKDAQQKFIKGLGQADQVAKERFGASFTKCKPEQRQELISDIENKASLPAEIFDFYQIMKQKTLQGYLSSEYVMTKQLIYEMAPGRYNGYFPVKAS